MIKMLIPRKSLKTPISVTDLTELTSKEVPTKPPPLEVVSSESDIIQSTFSESAIKALQEASFLAMSATFSICLSLRPFLLIL